LALEGVVSVIVTRRMATDISAGFFKNFIENSLLNLGAPGTGSPQM
jgi:hypothetical protein